MTVPYKYRLARFIGHQHYILRGRDRVIRTFASPDYAPSIPFSVDFFGLVYRGDLGSFIDWSVYVYGAYSKNELLLLRDLALVLRSALGRVTFYDIGANVGQHTVFMSPLVDRVVSFEPFPLVREKLEQKLSDNAIGNVTLFPVGLGSKDEDLPYTPPDGKNLGTGTFRSVAADRDTCVLPVRNGDLFFNQNALPRIDLMKIDVEGFESNVLIGLKETIKRDRPVILMELSSADRSGFGDKKSFIASIYDNFEMYSVRTTSISGTYRLGQTNFMEDEEIVIVPREHCDSLKSMINTN
jgi:FkbM family methyltransferase